MFVEIDSVVLGKIFKFRQCTSLFRNYPPLEKGGPIHLNKLETPSPKEAFVPSLVEIGSVVLEKKNFKFCQLFFIIS